MNDKKLLILLRSDPEEGLRKAIAEHGAAVNGVVRRVLRNASQEAEECCADVFVALWRHAEKLLSDAVPVRAWLLVTARNAAIDRWRKLTRREEFPLYEELTGDSGLPENISDLEAMLQELVESLQSPDREIFLRKYYLLETSKEIAEALSLTEGNVNVRLSRGRERLKRQLLQKGGDRYALCK